MRLEEATRFAHLQTLHFMHPAKDERMKERKCYIRRLNDIIIDWGALFRT